DTAPVLAVLSVVAGLAVLAPCTVDAIASAAYEGGSGGRVVDPFPVDEHLGIDGGGRALFASRRRVQRIRRLDHNLPETTSMLAVLAVVAVGAGLTPVTPVSDRSHGSVLAAADVRGGRGVVDPRTIDELLDMDGRGGTLLTPRQCIVRIRRLDE